VLVPGQFLFALGALEEVLASMESDVACVPFVVAGLRLLTVLVDNADSAVRSSHVRASARWVCHREALSCKAAFPPAPPSILYFPSRPA
jgi:hypothetical protein